MLFRSTSRQYGLVPPYWARTNTAKKMERENRRGREREGRKGKLAVAVEVFEAPPFSKGMRIEREEDRERSGRRGRPAMAVGGLLILPPLSASLLDGWIPPPSSTSLPFSLPLHLFLYFSSLRRRAEFWRAWWPSDGLNGPPSTTTCLSLSFPTLPLSSSLSFSLPPFSLVFRIECLNCTDKPLV